MRLVGLDYYGSMTPLPRLLLTIAWSLGCAFAAQAQAPAGQPAPPQNSSLDAPLFYQLLLGELNARGDEPGTGFSLILDAARKSKDGLLYQRAVDIAFQARSGDAALQAARAWKQALPESREANRYVLQILVALNRLPETVEPLTAEIRLAPENDRIAALSFVPRLYARAADKRLAASITEQGLRTYLGSSPVGAAAWTAIGRVRLAAGDTQGTLDATLQGHKAFSGSEVPVVLALEMMDPKWPQAEAVVKTYLAGAAIPEIRMGYARALLDAQRYSEATPQLEQITRQRPEFAEAWLVLGSVQTQEGQNEKAQASLNRYLDLVKDQPASQERSRGQAQAFLTLAQLAERRKDYAAAEAWLARIDNADELFSAQNRRASILARQGKLEEGRQLLRALPQRNAAEARSKLMAEVQLLRDHQQPRLAYDLLAQAIRQDPKDLELLYDQAMLAEKLERFDEMESLLRQLIAAKPEHHHAYNALGYSLADRNVRLTEARDLVRKALEFAPGDPFISDSLGWAEFRLGNLSEARRILEDAFKARPDAEIAAHLGEVLWTMGQKDRATQVWKEGLKINNDNETLVNTLKRLGVKL